MKDNAVCPYCNKWTDIDTDDLKNKCVHCHKFFVTDSEGLSYKFVDKTEAVEKHILKKYVKGGKV